MTNKQVIMVSLAVICKHGFQGPTDVGIFFFFFGCWDFLLQTLMLYFQMAGETHLNTSVYFPQRWVIMSNFSFPFIHWLKFYTLLSKSFRCILLSLCKLSFWISLLIYQNVTIQPSFLFLSFSEIIAHFNKLNFRLLKYQ